MKPVFNSSFCLKEDYYIRPLVESDVNNEYVNWLNDPETNKFISTARSKKVTLASQKKYVRMIRESSHDTIFGLYDNKNRLIGSSGIQKLNTSEVGPWLGVIIGPKDCRGKGLGAAMIWSTTYILFSYFDASEVFAGMQVSNVISFNSFQKIGYREHIDLTRKYNSKVSCSKNVIVVSCSLSELVDAKTIGITDVQIPT